MMFNNMIQKISFSRVNKSNSRAGYTLVEMLVSSAILVIVMGLVTLMYVKASMIYKIVINENEVQKAASQIMSLMVDGIRGGDEGLKGAKKINKISATEIEFTDQTGAVGTPNIRFKFNVDTVEKDNTIPLSWTDSENLDYSDKVNVKELKFYYFGNDVDQDNDGFTYENSDDPTNPATDDEVTTDITEVLIVLTVESTDPVKPQAITIYSSVKPRNIYKFE